MFVTPASFYGRNTIDLPSRPSGECCGKGIYISPAIDETTHAFGSVGTLAKWLQTWVSSSIMGDGGL